jgi:queuine tRNA-ribosyltransferase
MTDTFEFRVLGQDGGARLGRIDTPRGAIRTPAFMPVGTAGTVKALYFDQVRAAGSDIILGNTYHLMIRPGAERIAALGGLHRFTTWDGPDPHRFRRLPDHVAGQAAQGDRARRRVPVAPRRLAPRADAGALDGDPAPAGLHIQMQLDECVAYPHERQEAVRAMQLSLRWAERSRAAFGEQPGAGLLRHRAGRRRAGSAGESAAELPASASTATPSAGLPSARARR